MVGTNPTVRPAARSPSSSARSSAMVVTVFIVGSVTSVGGSSVGPSAGGRSRPARGGVGLGRVAGLGQPPGRVDHAAVGAALVGGQRPQVAAQRGLVAPGGRAR